MGLEETLLFLGCEGSDSWHAVYDADAYHDLVPAFVLCHWCKLLSRSNRGRIPEKTLSQRRYYMLLGSYTYRVLPRRFFLRSAGIFPSFLLSQDLSHALPHERACY